jgi:hypothetical protein
MGHNLEKATNIKLNLCILKQLFELKMNFYKSDFFFCFGQEKKDEEQYKKLFGCALGSLSFRYLEISIHLYNKKY